MVRFIIILLCLGYSEAQILDVTTSHSNLEERLLSLLLRLQQEQYVDTLLIYGEDCAFSSLSRRLQVPTVLVSSGSTAFKWNYSSLTLILSCEFQAEREENYRTLMKLQMNRRLILLKGNITPSSVCEFYSQKDQHNVAMVNNNFHQFGIVYACRLFQERNYEKVYLYEGKPIYVNHFRNMQGASIKSVTYNMVPGSMAYQDPKTGKLKYIGYVSNLLNNFVEKINATLEMQEKLKEDGRKTSFYNITKWASENLVDIGMSYAAYFAMDNFDTLSYPYMMTSNCFMVPLPDMMPYSEIYMGIVDPPVLIMFFATFYIFSVLLIYIKERSWRSLSPVNVLFNDICLRGFLAQPFPFPRQSNRKLKLIIMLVCFSSLISTTMYVAYLQSFMWGPPFDPKISSFADLQNSRFKLAIRGYDIELLRLLNVSREHVVVFDDPGQLEELRDSFDDSYMYPMTALSWVAVKEQQKLFTFPLFYYSEEVCLNPIGIFSFPIRRHLPYRDIFEEHMRQQNEFGLSKYWVDESFSDMVRLKFRTMEDIIPPQLADYIEVEDLSWVFGMYLTGLGISCCCFGLELLGFPSWMQRLRLTNWFGVRN
ncbi:uncharacterized protein LOC120446562 [Drosophila santomea]|uniref:uncharacterized protein LOC120446562 n=1 Tax=Drosophila santomea TaxID=129105 RepID=UPI001952FAB8|nr:uncharacterized protein LOC120446562 [Drosophila santomea]